MYTVARHFHLAAFEMKLDIWVAHELTQEKRHFHLRFDTKSTHFRSVNIDVAQTIRQSQI